MILFTLDTASRRSAKGWGQDPLCAGDRDQRPSRLQMIISVFLSSSVCQSPTLRVTPGLYQRVWPLAAAGLWAVGQAGVTGDAISRDQGAGAWHVIIIRILTVIMTTIPGVPGPGGITGGRVCFSDLTSASSEGSWSLPSCCSRSGLSLR